MWIDTSCMVDLNSNSNSRLTTEIQLIDSINLNQFRVRFNFTVNNFNVAILDLTIFINPVYCHHRRQLFFVSKRWEVRRAWNDDNWNRHFNAWIAIKVKKLSLLFEDFPPHSQVIVMKMQFEIFQQKSRDESDLSTDDDIWVQTIEERFNWDIRDFSEDFQFLLSPSNVVVCSLIHAIEQFNSFLMEMRWCWSQTHHRTLKCEEEFSSHMPPMTTRCDL